MAKPSIMHTPQVASLKSRQIQWTLAGPAFPTATTTYMMSEGSFTNGTPPDIHNPDNGDRDNNSPHGFTFSATYDIPGIEGAGQLRQSWSINPIVSLSSATPWTVLDNTTDNTGTKEIKNGSTVIPSWNYCGPTSVFDSSSHSIPWFSNISGCTTYSGDTRPAVRMNAAQAPYIGNTQLMQAAVALLVDLRCSCPTLDAVGFSDAEVGSGAARSIQLGLKLIFR
jgi:hypothetical protein